MYPTPEISFRIENINFNSEFLDWTVLNAIITVRFSTDCMGILKEFDVSHRRTLAPQALPVFMNCHLRLPCVRSCILLVASLTMSACATTEKNQGPDEYYRSSGWSDLKEDLPADSFRDYRESVIRRVQQHRFVINSDDRDNEITQVSPAEFAPSVSECESDYPLGIVVLVHGLSDTAFAMRDLAVALSTRCYLTRTLLLPGHGTVPGDLITVKHDDWLESVNDAVEQAANENDNVIVIGFSLGAVLGLSLALEPLSHIDALVSISPAFHLSSWRLARWAPLLHRLRPWVDRELPDDRYRYEAMPSLGVAETVRAIRDMHHSVSKASEGVTTPWMLVQSMDDAVIVPTKNMIFFAHNAADSRSRALLFQSKNSSSETPSSSDDLQIEILPGFDNATNVVGLTHVAVHISPNNSHYGIDGEYRNCGGTGGRGPEAVSRCESVATGDFDYVTWREPDKPDGRPSARSAFNPQFDNMVGAMADFLGEVTNE